MKKTILLIVCLAFAIPALAQGGTKLAIKGLHNPKKTALMNVTSAVIENNTCIVTKTLDRHSEKLEQAAETGKVFQKAFIKFDGVDGEINKELTTVYIRDYIITSQGNTTIETFTMYYNKIAIKE